MASPSSTSESFPDSNGSVGLAETETSYSSGVSSPATAAAAVAPLQQSQHSEGNDLTSSVSATTAVASSAAEKLPCKFQCKSPLTVGLKSLTVDNGTSVSSLSPSSVQSSDTVVTANLTHCYLCVKMYDQPKVLACFHTFCKACLEKLVDSPDKIICPLCGAETQLCPEQGVDSLLCDYALANLQEQSKAAAAAVAKTGGKGQQPSDQLQDQGDQSSRPDSPGSQVVSCGQCFGSVAPAGGGQASATPATTNTVNCTGCKSKESVAVARCFDCSNFLCANCVMAHQFMHCFEGHRVIELSQVASNDVAVVDRPVKCLQHRQENLQYFCLSCNIPICKECTLKEHARDNHRFEKISEIGSQQKKYMQKMLEEAQAKQRNFSETFKRLDGAGQRLQMAFHKAQQDIAETSSLLQQMVIEQRQHALKDLENAYHNKQVSISLMDKKLQQLMERLSHIIDFTSRLLKFANEAEILVFKKLLETRLQAILSYNPDFSSITQHEVEFVPNLQAARVSLMNTFGYVRQSQDLSNFSKSVLPPISRPIIPGSMSNGGQPNAQSPVNPMNASLSLSVTNHLLPSLTTGTDALSQIGAAANENSAALSKQYGDSSQSLGPFSTLGSDYNYEKWSNASAELYNQNGTMTPSVQQSVQNMMSENMYGPMSLPAEHGGGGGGGGSPQVVELNPKLINNSVMFFPPKAQIKRHKMIYHCKFGEFGVMEGQFTEPSGVAVNAQGDIIVADTNNHRIQIFDKEGRFKFQFGECGKRDGQLLYPNRVAVNRVTGDIVVTERSPTHQIQVYNQYGQFLRKFAANVLQHPRGVTVDSKGRIVVVECKVMRVIILDMFGNVLQKFSCSKYLEFPNGVVTNDKQEIFVSDNRAHCVKVFNYDGVYMRQIGGEGLTNYPIGVGINNLGEIIIADNHNNFNLTIFQQDGTLVNALESKVKHAQCFDVALLDDGSIVLSSKDYRLYIYRYVQVPPMFM